MPAATKKAAVKKAAPHPPPRPQTRKASDRPQITHSTENITPTQAKRMLEANKVNRPLRLSNIEKYARDMVSGHFDSHTVIQLDWDGNLINGQHRLNAVLVYGKPVTFVVIRNLPPEYQQHIDTGVSRTIGDVLHFRGEINGGLLGAIARSAYLVETTRYTGSRRAVSNQEIIDTIEIHPTLRVSTELANWGKGRTMTPIPPSVLGVAHWMISEVNGIDEATDFINRVVTCANEKEGSPILALARRANEIKRQGIKVKIRDLLALVIKAWNYDATGKSVHKLTLYSKGGDFVLPDVDKRTYIYETDQAYDPIGDEVVKK